MGRGDPDPVPPADRRSGRTRSQSSAPDPGPSSYKIGHAWTEIDDNLTGQSSSAPQPSSVPQSVWRDEDYENDRALSRRSVTVSDEQDVPDGRMPKTVGANPFTWKWIGAQLPQLQRDIDRLYARGTLHRQMATNTQRKTVENEVDISNLEIQLKELQDKLDNMHKNFRMHEGDIKDHEDSVIRWRREIPAIKAILQRINDPSDEIKALSDRLDQLEKNPPNVQQPPSDDDIQALDDRLAQAERGARAAARRTQMLEAVLRREFGIADGIELNTDSDWRAARTVHPATAAAPANVNAQRNQGNQGGNDNGENRRRSEDDGYGDQQGQRSPTPRRRRDAPDPDSDPDSEGNGGNGRRGGHRGNFDRQNSARGDTPGTNRTDGLYANKQILKREQIGVFNPSYPDLEGIGVVHAGKDLIYTDVFAFKERLETFTEDNPDAADQLLELFPTLLNGAAVSWWSNELVPAQRREYRFAGLTGCLLPLTDRFAMEPSRASAKFVADTLTLREIAIDENNLNKFIQSKLRYARAMGILLPDNLNWHGTMVQVWSKMSLDIRQYLRPPSKRETLAAYMRQVEEAKANLIVKADEDFPGLAERERSKQATKMAASYQTLNPSVAFTSSTYSNRREKADTRDRGRDDRRRDRDNFRRGDRYDRKEDTRKRDDDRKRDDFRKRDDRDWRDRDRPRDDRDRGNRIHFVDGDADNESSSSADSPFDGAHSDNEVHLVVNDYSIDSEEDLIRRTCVHCDALFETRNRLFRHVPSCPRLDTKAHVKREIRKRVRNLKKNTQEAQEAHHLEEEDIQYEDEKIVRETKNYNQRAQGIGGYTWLRVKVRPSANGTEQVLCCDPGTGHSLATRSFLDNFEHTIEGAPMADRQSIRGVAGKSVTLTHRATFKFFAKGLTNGDETNVAKLTATAWVMEDDMLTAGCLLGNDWLHPRQTNIDFGTEHIVCPDLDHFRIPFSATKRSAYAVVRKVTTLAKKVLQPGETMILPVDYKNLPKGRSFMFTSTHHAVLNSLMDARTPKGVALHNTSKEAIVIPKRTRVGTIHECEESRYIEGNLDDALRALEMASADGIINPVAVPSDRSLAPDACFKPSVAFAGNVSPLGAEFTLTDEILNMFEVVSPGSTSDEHTCAVFNLTQEELGTIGLDALDAKPRLEKDVPGSLNIGTPTDAPSLVTNDGIHIYNLDPSKARRLQKIAEAYPELWVDKGPIDMPEDQQMKVPLAEGWQNAKLGCHPYPVSKRDKEVIDKKHDQLHEQGRLSWPNGVCPITIPVFVVWRKVHDEPRSRVVADLRPVNKWSIPDNYPLPLQADVIESCNGKRYISVMDATSFFFQFLVHKDYRDRFTYVSHRGLEQSNVAPMGFRNSPAHAQRFMDRLLKPFNHFCRAFIDDVVVFSDNWEDHQRHLEDVFKLFTDRGVSISPTKTYLGYPSVELLGFYVDALGLTTTKERTQGFRDLSFPRNLKALETYLGSTGFIRMMVPYYAQISGPLQQRKVDLLAKGREAGKLVTGNMGKRAAYTSQTTFEPSPEELKSFEDLQEFVTNQLRLYHHCPDRRLFLQIDGSLERGFGVMLFHLKREYEWKKGQSDIPATAIEPVMFLSRCLTSAELNYGPSELEVACLVWATKRLRTTILNNRQPVVVLTDHSAIKGIIEQTSLNTTSTDRSNRRLVNASIYLSEYQFEVYHIAGRLNLVPDALSRLATPGDDETRQRQDTPTLDDIFERIPDAANLVISEAVMSDEMRLRFRQAYKEDTIYGKMIEDLASSTNRKPHHIQLVKDNEDVVSASKAGHPFRFVDGLLYNRDNDGIERLVIPSPLVQEFLQDAHDHKHHFGRDRMMADLERVHFRRKRHLVTEYVRKCYQCGEQRKDNQLPIGDLKPIQAPEEPMHTITIDFIVGLPENPVNGTPWDLGNGFSHFNALLTVTDKSSKRRSLIPGNEKYTAEDWANALARQMLMADWSFPKVIISDRDAKFLSAFWTGLWKSFGTRLMMTTAHHPQSDGQSENTNYLVELAIRHWCTEHAPEYNWVDILPALQWHMNNSYSRVIDASPHEFLYGFRLSSPADRLAGPIPKQVDDIRFMREHLRRDAQLSMDIVAAEAKRLYDAKHRQIEFNVGDKVWLKYGKAYKPMLKGSKKTRPLRGGPYTITRKVTSLAYELNFNKVDPNHRVNPVVSIQYLLPFDCDNDPFGRQLPPPEAIAYDSDSTAPSGDEHFEVEKIVDRRVVLRGRKRTPVTEYLVRWRGYAANEDQWRTLPQLKHCRELVNAYDQRHPTNAPKRGRSRPRKNA